MRILRRHRWILQLAASIGFMGFAVGILLTGETDEVTRVTVALLMAAVAVAGFFLSRESRRALRDGRGDD